MTSANQLYAKIHRSQAVSGLYRNFRRERQMDVLEARLATDFAGRRGLDVLDVCCGQGRLLHYLSKFDPAQRYVGLDYVDEVVDLARENLGERDNVEVKQGDLFALSANSEARFDITILYKTLLNFEAYENVLEQLFAATREKIYISSLFYEGDADFINRIYKYRVFDKPEDFVHYNVYGMPRFVEHCRSLGAREIEFHDLEIDVDLPEPDDKDLVGAHTRKLEDGRRLELTGVIVMPWRLAEITL